ncbi:MULTISPECIES: phage head morphogenesis protein [unclassified Bacillus (in: firmicutes)]|uniref:phage head morphogenesis protein n=1 Tax=unclassified Bacillus (in: firmicutes) TaxID=185979 RepID=UPI00227ED020|nr:phage head morphogenesis protein [Bacillus sp. S20C3]MCY8290299.1 phage head morphogenesis protein [Bacillus sp. N13C7]MCY8637688.1 phage head morphogenesis protein [Bacillus sp. S17B2]MCY9144753.1 phage head morphogenesis protein [Bacillus sp. T9C1]
MNKTDKLLDSLNAFIQKAEEDEREKLVEVVPDFPGLSKIPGFVEEYEKGIARLLRRQRKKFLDGLNGFIGKDSKETLEALLVFFTQNLFAEDDFEEEFHELTEGFLQQTVEELAGVIMDSLDPDVPFEALSTRAADWIKGWSEKLAKVMKLNTHEAVENVLTDAIENGSSIQDIELRLKDMPQFDRERARATAITEVLAASSAAQHESYTQSPAVKKKKWRHSGGKKNNPRENHIDLDDTVIGVDEEFQIPGSNETCMFPRDPKLSAGERVHCHCVLSPVVDNEILGLSVKEKEEIRREVLANME